MLYAQINDANEVVSFPLSEGDVRAMFPDTSFPAGPLAAVDLSHLNIVPVDPTKTTDMPVLEDGMQFHLDAAVWNDDQTKLVRVYSQVPAVTD